MKIHWTLSDTKKSSKQEHFHRKYFPLAGAAYGILLGMRMQSDEFKHAILFSDEFFATFDLSFFLMGTGSGVVAGFALYIMDVPKPKEGKQATLFGTTLAILSVVMCLVPLVGIFFTMMTRFVNRKTSGWVWTASHFTFCIALFIAAIILVALI